MADSHAFELTVQRAALPGLAAAINGRLALETPPVTAEGLLALAQDPDPNHLCLTFLFVADNVLSALAAEHPDLWVPPGSVTVGYIFVSAMLQGEAIDLCFFSTSHKLAMVMRESPQVRAFFRSLGAQVQEVNEWNQSRPLSP
ncbi:MAG: hypothetical protein K6T57_09530 [Thermaceae bacterium]|nr:hypothetical protein [Thermaceae bacterium]